MPIYERLCVRIAIMQPYFLPYIGYFQLIHNSDQFVIFDNVQYIKGGWINRNRILINGRPHFITVPLRKASPNKTINALFLMDDGKWQQKLLTTIRTAYGRAPHFLDIYPVVEQILNCQNKSLSSFLEYSLLKVCELIKVSTPITLSSRLAIDPAITGQDRVLAICKQLSATHYVNSIGGTALYSREVFEDNSLRLGFLRPEAIEYYQGVEEFVPTLSILDVLMFNSVEQTSSLLNKYSIV